MHLNLKKVEKGKFEPSTKKNQSHLIELKIYILINFKVITSKNNEFKPGKVQKG